jgi:hypothetical protein
MRARYRTRYRPLGKKSSRLAWWQRFPKPVETAALRLWGRLPRMVRHLLSPLGELFGPHTVSAAAHSNVGEDLPVVTQLRREGFEPVERYTGAVWVAELWPEEHRRSVPETRAWALEDQPGARVWLVRSPWPAIDLEAVFALLWRWVERDRESLSDAVWRSRVAEVFGWNETRARDWYRASEQA